MSLENYISILAEDESALKESLWPLENRASLIWKLRVDNKCLCRHVSKCYGIIKSYPGLPDEAGGRPGWSGKVEP